MKKIFMIILDGLGDRPNEILNGRTALQAAYRPNLNHLSQIGLNGLMAPISDGLRVGSDTSHLSLLGYNPLEVYTGRGPFEAMGLGMEVKPGDIAFRANFATRNEDNIIVDRRAGRINSGTDKLAEILNMEIDGIKFYVKEGVEHRAALLLRGDNLSDMVTDSDPHSVGLPPHRVEARSKEADFTASVINKFLERSRELLSDDAINTERKKNGEMQANEILIRGPGKAPMIQPFSENFGLKGACVVGIPMIAGICNLVGMDVIKFKGATGRVDTDYEGKVRTSIEALKTYDFVLMNIKAPDVAGHDGDPLLKTEVIERIDKALANVKNILDETVVVITGDHSTPCSTRDHTGDSVPIIFATSGIRRDRATLYDEVNSSKGALRISSNNVMLYLMNLSDRAEKYGA